MKVIATGAEAIIYQDGNLIIKERQSKDYRIPEIDTKLIKSRTKKEAKILLKLYENGIKVPRLIKTEENKIYMEEIPGKTLKHELTDENQAILMSIAGEMIGKMHNLDIIHGDLTTLNYIFNGDLFLIDFGLSFHSIKDEDKAVDLYVFEKAVKCSHKEEYINAFYEGYSKTGSLDVLKRLENVRLRGRKREESILM